MVHNDDFIIKGPPLYTSLSKISVGILLHESLSRNNKKHLFTQAETKEKVTYGEYFESTCRLAQALKNAGFRKNDVVSVCSENNLAFFQPVIASLYLGMVISPINHDYKENEILHILNLTRPKAAFCSRAVASKFISLQKKCTFLEKIIVLNSDTEIPQTETLETFKNINTDKYFNANSFRPIDVEVEKQVAIILCSSGTTGLPKGVMISHANINLRLAHSSDPNLHIINGGNKIGVLPFFHGFGFMITVSSIIHGEMVVVLSKFDEELYYSTIQNYRVCELTVAPPVLVMMSKSHLALKYDFSSVKHVICGAAPLGKNIEDIIKKRLNLPIRQGYGLTEATLAVMLMPTNVQKPGSSGKTVPGMSCKIRDPKTGETLGPLQTGELCVKGGLVTMGYINNPQATSDTFTKDGWVLTGDMAYFDKDGFFYIVDRLKELIKYKSFQVAPAELEALLLKHPKIKDVGVVGLPDELAGELPLAFVVKDHDAKLTHNEVKEYVKVDLSLHCKQLFLNLFRISRVHISDIGRLMMRADNPKHVSIENVTHTKWLHGGVIFVDAIPKNPSGKILRRELRDMLKKMAIKSKM